MRDKIKKFIVGQLKQGATPKGLAKTLAMGLIIALFPVLGTTTVLCLIAGSVWRLNQPTLQAVNYVLAPVQFIMIPIFLKMGAWICGVTAVSVNPSIIVESFAAAPGKFLTDYGWAGLQAILAWFLVAPLMFFLMYWVSRQILEKLSAKRSL